MDFQSSRDVPQSFRDGIFERKMTTTQADGKPTTSARAADRSDLSRVGMTSRKRFNAESLNKWSRSLVFGLRD